MEVNAPQYYRNIEEKYLKIKMGYYNKLYMGSSLKVRQYTYFCFPSIGDKPMITEASADFTCWLASATNSLMHGRMLFIITSSWISAGRFWQKSKQIYIYVSIQNKDNYSSNCIKKYLYFKWIWLPLTLWAAAALTSASQSFNKFWNAGTRSVFVISGPTAFCI